jgi:predicted transcriptional regulator
MNSVKELHRAQASILRSLRYSNAARYSALMRPTGLESDVFKFHLRKLVHQKFIDKDEQGEYFLTPSGKEFANNLSKVNLAVQKQPKLSVAIIASKETPSGTVYLLQKRKRNPFYGFWGFITGPVQWGSSIEETAAYELKKQTGLIANCEVISFHRKTDLSASNGEILEDKLFAVVVATKIIGDVENKWSGGFNEWMSLDDLEKQEKHFKSSRDLVNMLIQGNIYSAEKSFYADADY